MSGPHHRKSGFTMVELLVVMAIIMIMFVLAVVSVSSMTSSSTLTQAGEMITSVVSMARQEAVSRSRPVEVRFYQLPDDDAGANASWNAMQLWELTESNTGVQSNALSKPWRLPKQVIISKEATLSPLLSVDPSVSGTQDRVAGHTGLAYVGFRVDPDGSLDDLIDNSNNFLLLHSFRETASIGALPANYAAIQVNPLTGAVQLYRP